jgi:hypothetical protein
MHGQGFDWRVIYGSYGAQEFPEEMRISEAGMIYSRITYFDVPPFQWDTGHVLEKRDQAGNRLWWYGRGGGGNIPFMRFDHDSEDNIYILEERSDSSRTLRKKTSDLGDIWWMELYGQYDDIEVYRDRIYLIDWAWSSQRKAHAVSIAQYDTTMKQKWERTYTFPQGETMEGFFIYTDMAGSLYLLGTRVTDEDDVFFLTYDIAGTLVNEVWEKGPEGRSERGSGIVTSEDGDIYVLSTVDNQNDTRSAWITKYGPAGDVEWAKPYETKVSLAMVNIVPVPGNRFIAGGRFGGTQVIFEIDSDGNELWRMPTDVIYTFSLLESGPGGELYLGNVYYDIWSCMAKYTRHLVAVDALPDPAAGGAGCILTQNYPNPFNPSTTIEFSIPSRGDVRLTVFDHLGREVAVLADGEYQAGTHSCKFTSAEQLSGVFMYRLSWNGNSVARRMVLLR